MARAAKLAPGLPRPSTLRKYAPFATALKEVRPETFDLVWAERPHIAAMCANLRARTILDLDDIEHVKIGRLLKQSQALLGEFVHPRIILRQPRDEVRYRQPKAERYPLAVLASGVMMHGA